MRTMRISAISALVTVLVAGTAAAQSRGIDLPFDDMRYWSASVPVVYSGGGWDQNGSTLAQLCHGPFGKGYSGPQPSVLRVLDSSGGVIVERFIANPRVILPEVPGAEDWQLADSATMRLNFSLGLDATTVEFWETLSQPTPTLVFDLRSAIALAQQQPSPGCQKDNPPVVPIGDGRYVLTYVLDRVVMESRVSEQEILSLMLEHGTAFEGYAIANDLMPYTTLFLLRDATVRRLSPSG